MFNTSNRHPTPLASPHWEITKTLSLLGAKKEQVNNVLFDFTYVKPNSNWLVRGCKHL
jgi:hypothetical protein